MICELLLVKDFMSLLYLQDIMQLGGFVSNCYSDAISRHLMYSIES